MTSRLKRQDRRSSDCGRLSGARTNIAKINRTLPALLSGFGAGCDNDKTAQRESVAFMMEANRIGVRRRSSRMSDRLKPHHCRVSCGIYEAPGMVLFSSAKRTSAVLAFK